MSRDSREGAKKIFTQRRPSEWPEAGRAKDAKKKDAKKIFTQGAKIAKEERRLPAEGRQREEE